MARTNQYFTLATRILAELGANFVKTYYCENFETVVAACPVPIVIAGLRALRVKPIVIAGGKKLPENEALEMAYKAIQSGAHGVDMGRNVFQSEHPVEMLKSIRKVVHEGFTGKEAFEFYTDAIN